MSNEGVITILNVIKSVVTIIFLENGFVVCDKYWESITKILWTGYLKTATKIYKRLISTLVLALTYS